MEVECQVLLFKKKIYLKGTKSHLPCAFGGAHAEKKLLKNMKMLVHTAFPITQLLTQPHALHL